MHGILVAHPGFTGFKQGAADQDGVGVLQPSGRLELQQGAVEVLRAQGIVVKIPDEAVFLIPFQETPGAVEFRSDQILQDIHAAADAAAGSLEGPGGAAPVDGQIKVQHAVIPEGVIGPVLIAVLLRLFAAQEFQIALQEVRQRITVIGTGIAAVQGGDII